MNQLACPGYPYLKVADQHRLNNQWKEAITLYDKALKIGNMDQESVNNTYYNLGVCYEEIDDVENAIQSLKKALAINPSDKDSLFNLGMFSARMEHFSDAVNAFKEYLLIDSSSQDADQVSHALKQATSQSNNIGIRQKIDNAMRQADIAIKQKDAKEFDIAATMLKECLNVNISHENRMTIHFSLGCMLSMDLEIPKLLSQNQIDEAATNYDFAAHIYDYFIKPDDPNDRLEQIRQSAKARLDHFVFQLGGSVKYWKGPWAKNTILCSNFTFFKGYPEKHYGSLQKYETDLKQEEQNYRLKNKLCLSCGEKLGFGDKLIGSKYCKKHRT